MSCSEIGMRKAQGCAHVSELCAKWLIVEGVARVSWAVALAEGQCAVFLHYFLLSKRI